MAASITTANLEIKIAAATTKLAQDTAALGQLRSQLPGATARVKAATDAMVSVGLVVNNLINTYIRNKNIFGQWETGWIRSPQNIEIWNAYGGRPVRKALEDVNAAKVALAQKEGLLRIPTMELNALNAKIAIAQTAVSAGTRNVAALKKSLATELAKPDTTVAKAAAQAVVDSANMSWNTARQATINAKADVVANTKIKNTKLAAYSVAHGITLKAQALFNTLKAKVAQEKARKQILPATTAAFEAAQAALTKAIADEEIPANAEYKAISLQLSANIELVTRLTQAEAKAAASLAAAKLALAKIK